MPRLETWDETWGPTTIADIWWLATEARTVGEREVRIQLQCFLVCRISGTCWMFVKIRARRRTERMCWRYAGRRWYMQVSINQCWTVSVPWGQAELDIFFYLMINKSSYLMDSYFPHLPLLCSFSKLLNKFHWPWWCISYNPYQSLNAINHNYPNLI